MRLLNQSRYECPWPANLATADRMHFAADQSHLAPDTDLHRIEGVVFNSAGEIYSSGSILPQWFPRGEPNARRDRRDFAGRLNLAGDGTRDFAGEFLWITDRFAANYYHWLCDALPRLEAVLPFVKPTKLLLPRRTWDAAFVRESLQAYGEIDLVEPPPAGQGGRASALLIPDHVADNGQHRRELAVRVRDRLTGHFAPKAGCEKTGRRIYVSRRKARIRRIANETELAPMLERLGFETVDLENMSFAAQVAMMREAKIIAGPHGAGLANMLFMASGGAVVEIRQLAGPPNAFFTLAGATGQNYFYAAAEALSPGVHSHAADLVISPRRLEEILAAVTAMSAP